MDHAATMQRAYDLINTGDIDGFGELLSDTFVEHEELPGLESTRDGVKQWFVALRSAFADLRMDVEDMIASGDKVVTRFRMTGTNDGTFMGIPATGRHVDAQGIDIVRFGESGLGVEHWGVFDALVMMQQLGAIPDGPPA